MFANHKARCVVLALCLAAPTAGCSTTGTARYVYQDHESGVIAVSQLTPKTMAQATTLMEKHFPTKNYEIVRSVEIEEGDRTVYESDLTKTSVSPGVTVRPHLLRGLTATIGGGQASHDRDREHADRVKIKETRIVYRKSNPSLPASIRYAANVAYQPAYYVDHFAATLEARSSRAGLVSASTKDHAVEAASTSEEIALPKSANPFTAKSKN